MHTPYNYPILFYGRNRNKSIVLITKHIKENGYITSYSSEWCDKDNITTEEVYDHQFIICDPNKENTISGNTIQCLYGKLNIEHLYEYAE